MSDQLNEANDSLEDLAPNESVPQNLGVLDDNLETNLLVDTLDVPRNQEDSFHESQDAQSDESSTSLENVNAQAVNQNDSAIEQTLEKTPPSKGESDSVAADIFFPEAVTANQNESETPQTSTDFDSTSQSILDEEPSDSEVQQVESTIEKSNLIDDMNSDTNLLTPEEYLSAIDEVIAELVETRESIQSQTSELDQRFDDIATLRDAMQQWVDERKHSFAWKLAGTLQGEIDRAVAAENYVSQWASNELQLGTETPDKVRRKFKRRALIGAVICGLLFAAVGLVTHFALTTFGIVLIAGFTLLKMAIVALSAYVIHFLGSTMSYFRSWQKFKANIERELARAKYLSDLALHSRQEIQRLRGLQSQIPEYLEIIATSVQQPWEVPDALLELDNSSLDIAYIPASLELAVPSDKSPGAIKELERRGLIKLISPGWRARSYANLIAAISEKIGSSAFTVESIDADTGRDGARGVFKQNVGESDVRSDVGRRMARELARSIQTDVLPKVKPAVEAIRPDVLADLDVSTEILPEAGIGIVGWDEFLQAVIAPGCEWSPLLASAGGAHTLGQMSTGTTLFVPESLATQARLALGVAEVSDENIIEKNHVIVLEPPGVKPIDIAIRIDQSGILSTDDVRAFLPGGVDDQPADAAPGPTLEIFKGGL